MWPGPILGTGGAAETKTDHVSHLKKLTSWWGSQ